jgi:hypothetical protein
MTTAANHLVRLSHCIAQSCCLAAASAVAGNSYACSIDAASHAKKAQEYKQKSIPQTKGERATKSLQASNTQGW